MHESSQTISHCQLCLQLKTFKLLHLIFEARVPRISDISFVKRVFTQLNVIEEAYHEVHMTHIPQVAPPPSTPLYDHLPQQWSRRWGFQREHNRWTLSAAIPLTEEREAGWKAIDHLANFDTPGIWHFILPLLFVSRVFAKNARDPSPGICLQ